MGITNSGKAGFYLKFGNNRPDFLKLSFQELLGYISSCIYNSLLFNRLYIES